MVDEQPNNYNLTELLACVASHLLEDGCSIFVGTGLPMIAAMLAQRTHAPNLLIIFEAGGVGPQPPVLPISVGDSRTFHRAVMASSMHDVMSACCAGYIDYGFLGGAAVDRYGNLNTTIFGDWQRPKVRLPGSGGANDIGSFCWRTIYLMRNQSTRTFMQKLPFVTTPGYLDGPRHAVDAARGLRRERPAVGPAAVERALGDVGRGEDVPVRHAEPAREGLHRTGRQTGVHARRHLELVGVVDAQDAGTEDRLGRPGRDEPHGHRVTSSLETAYSTDGARRAPGRTATVGATGADAAGAVLAARVRGRRGTRLSPTAPAAAPSAAGPCDRTSGAGRSRGP